MTMKLFAVLSVVCAMSIIVNVSHAQVTKQDVIALIQLRERVEKAQDAGVSLFGIDKRIPATPNKLFVVATVKGDKPIDLKVGDWGYTFRMFKVLSVVSESEVLVLPSANDSEPMLIRGSKTDKVTDGVEFILRRPFTISGTYKYESVGGSSKTVLVLDTIKVEERFKEIEAAAEKDRAAAEEASYRTWRIGGEEFVAKYAGYTKGLVTLIRKEDGSTVEAKVSSLEKSDQRWVVGEIKRAKDEKAAKANSVEDSELVCPFKNLDDPNKDLENPYKVTP